MVTAKRDKYEKKKNTALLLEWFLLSTKVQKEHIFILQQEKNYKVLFNFTILHFQLNFKRTIESAELERSEFQNTGHKVWPYHPLFVAQSAGSD